MTEQIMQPKDHSTIRPYWHKLKSLGFVPISIDIEWNHYENDYDITPIEKNWETLINISNCDDFYQNEYNSKQTAIGVLVGIKYGTISVSVKPDIKSLLNWKKMRGNNAEPKTVTIRAPDGTLIYLFKTTPKLLELFNNTEITNFHKKGIKCQLQNKIMIVPQE
ncbi:MAG: hypothetical protein Hyperionvirus16_29 [Hyperionvirus sp.]|uniref:Uncharacterized protein n=1 Tax=Hyperionvirus sp. TaxID=2487770 RepID=A0A3G5ABU9_9VIRU|nr:MAG: hypothetical protein Hyperionvirus16_29 [Hyperionvirus sp.]